MIISASRRTDIPAFYGQWFINRIKEGFFVRVNPFNPNQRKVTSLLPKDVTAIVFSSKNPAPFLGHLDLLDSMGYPYYFLFTINNYPPVYEEAVPGVDQGLETFKALSRRLGKERVIWRYDPILLSQKTSVSFHLDNFTYLADELKGYTGRCVFSLVELYDKVRPRLERLDPKYQVAGDLFSGSMKEEAWGLVKELKKIGEARGIELASCAGKLDFGPLRIKKNACIDGSLIQRITGRELTLPRDRNQRKECGCAVSVDVGMYNTCLHRCVYCYANFNDRHARANFQRHSPDSPVMIGDCNSLTGRIGTPSGAAVTH